MSREESLQYLKMKTKEANLPGLLGIVNLVEAQQLARSVSDPTYISNSSGWFACIYI